MKTFDPTISLADAAKSSGPDKVAALQYLCGADPDGAPGPKTRAAIERVLQGGQSTSAPPPEQAPITIPVDPRSEAAIATLLLPVQIYARELVQRCAAEGIAIKVTSGNRTYAEQNALFEQGRSLPGPRVTNARGGQSNHNFGIAFDVTIFDGDKPIWDSPQYQRIGAIGKALGLEWGGDWKTIVDEPHFELRPAWAKGLSEGEMLAELRERHASGRAIFS